MALNARGQERQPHQPNRVSGLRDLLHIGQPRAISVHEPMCCPKSLDEHGIAIWGIALDRLDPRAPSPWPQHRGNSPPDVFRLVLVNRRPLALGKHGTDGGQRSGGQHELDRVCGQICPYQLAQTVIERGRDPLKCNADQRVHSFCWVPLELAVRPDTLLKTRGHIISVSPAFRILRVRRRQPVALSVEQFSGQRRGCSLASLPLGELPCQLRLDSFERGSIDDALVL